MTDRAKIIDRVRALLAKTVENGCTEAEALAAAELASRLMEEYELSRLDVDSVKQDKYGIRSVPGVRSEGGRFHPVWNCCHALQSFCNVHIWMSGSTCKLFGAEADTEFAKYLITIIQIAMEREVAAFLRGPDRPPSRNTSSLRASFLAGMTRRIVDRLKELDKSRAERLQSSETGRALVVVKSQEVNRRFKDYMADSGLKLKAAGGRRTVSSLDAYTAGKRAGDRVAFGKPVSGKSNALLH